MTTEEAPKHEPSKSTEIERKWLISPSAIEALAASGWDINNYPHKKIDQGYLANTPDCAVRVRRKGDKFFLTYKVASTTHTTERVELETSEFHF